MKREGILNRALNAAICEMGHGDMMIIADAALPVPPSCNLVDLAIEKDLPDILSILRLVNRDMICEKCLVAQEQHDYNPEFYSAVCDIMQEIPVASISHEIIRDDLRLKAKVIVRTGSFMPWGNVILYSGINLPEWFSKTGNSIPDHYYELNK